MNSVNVFLTVLLLLPAALANQKSPLEVSVRNLQQLLNEQIQKQNIPNSPHLIPSLNKQPNQAAVQSTALTKDIDLSDLSSSLSSIQTSIDEVFEIVGTILNSTNATAVVLEEGVITPLLSFVNTLSQMSLVQSVDTVYAAVLVVQTVLTVANTTLVTLTAVAVDGTNILDTVQAVVDTIFSIILTLLP